MISRLRGSCVVSGDGSVCLVQWKRSARSRRVARRKAKRRNGQGTEVTEQEGREGKAASQRVKPVGICAIKIQGHHPQILGLELLLGESKVSLF